MNPTRYTLHPNPTPYPTPYTLHPTPYTLHPTPYTYTLNPFCYEAPDAGISLLIGGKVDALPKSGHGRLSPPQK